jgi:hypothetical protein
MATPKSLEEMRNWVNTVILTAEDGPGLLGKNWYGKSMRIRVAILAALEPVTENWTPTAVNINALSEPIRKYIHDLETNCDPAGMVQENACLRENVKALEAILGNQGGAVTEEGERGET